MALTRPRIHVFGAGARMRRICAALVADAIPEAAVAEFGDARQAREAAEAHGERTALVDARLAPGAEFAELARGGAGSGIARGFDGTPRAGAAALVVTGPGADERGPARVVGDWLDDPALAAAPPAHGELVEIHSHGLGHGGYASAARNTVVGLHRAGVAVRWRQIYEERRDVDIDPDDRALLERLATTEGRTERALVIHPPTHITGQLFLERYVDAFASRPYACYTMFETDRVPARWPRTFVEAGRVWVPSRFNVETFAASGVPRELIDYVPLGLEVERLALDGAAYAIPERRRFAFLSVFGFSGRKGWDVLVAAWAQAFAPDDDVMLVLRTNAHGVDVRAEIARSLAARRLDPARTAPIVVLERPLSAAELAGLYRSADAFVLPSRGEGVGLPYLEAMAFGLPTIGTDWGGATEFLSAATGYPVPSELVPVERATWRVYPTFRDQRWAEPSVAGTARALRTLYDDRAGAATRAARGCALARRAYNRTWTGRIAADALARIVARRGVAAPQSPGVRYEGEAFSAGGAGASVRAAIAALGAAGVGVGAVVRGGADQRAALFVEEARVLCAALARDPGGARVAIVQGDPRALEPPAGGTPAIARVRAASVDAQSAGCLAPFARVWVPTAAAAERLTASGYDAARIAVVPEAIDVDRWTPQLGALSGLGDADAFRFLYVGALDERGGYDRAIGAFLRAFEPDEPVMLALKVPAGPLDPATARNLVAAAAARHAPHRVAALGRYRIPVLAGLVPEGDYMQLVGSFDASIVLPRAPGWGRALLEAMASAHACIVSRDDHCAPVAGETAFVAGGDDVAALAATLRAVVGDPLEALRRGHAARRAVVARHSLAAAGALARAELARLVTLPDAPARTDDVPGELGIVLDLRAGAAPDAEAFVAARTRTPHRIVSFTEGPSLAGAFARVRDCAYVAYVAGDVRPSEAWDAVLIDALRSRPLVAVAVPRIVGAPPPQGIGAPARPGGEPMPFDDFARGLVLTQVGRGTPAARVVASCAVIDGPLVASLLARTPLTHPAELIAAAGAGGRAWCAYDTAVARAGERPWEIVELGG